MSLAHLASATARMAKTQASRTVSFSRTGSCSLMNHGKNTTMHVSRPYYAAKFSSHTLSRMQSMPSVNDKLRIQSLLTKLKMRHQKRNMSSVESSASGSRFKIFDLSGGSNLKLALGAMLVLQATWGSTPAGQPYYDYRWIAKKDPDDVASFYGGEELMELFCVLPMMTNLMLRGAEFDDEGNVTAPGMPGTMSIQMVFSDEYDDDAEQTSWFNKRERFKNTLFGITLWDMVINYGFTRLPDGRTEVYHQAEYFKGYAPPLSLVMKLVFRLHARYVVWAAEHHINHYAFTAETEAQEKLEEESRSFALLRLMKEYFVDDVKAMAIGSNKDTDSFLTKDDEDESEIEEEMSEEVNEMPEIKEEDIIFAKPRVAILNRRSTVSSVVNLKKRIEDDIAFDKTLSLDELKIPEGALARTQTTGKAFGEAYQMATLSAMQKHKTRVVRRRSTRVKVMDIAAAAPSTGEEKSVA